MYYVLRTIKFEPNGSQMTEIQTVQAGHHSVTLLLLYPTVNTQDYENFEVPIRLNQGGN